MKVRPIWETPIYMLRNYGVADGEEERIVDAVDEDKYLPARLKHEIEDFIESGDLFAAIKVYVKHYIPSEKIGTREVALSIVAWCLDFSDNQLADFKYVFESVLDGMAGVYGSGDVDELLDML